jgi:hypothetical protein
MFLVVGHPKITPSETGHTPEKHFASAPDSDLHGVG